LSPDDDPPSPKGPSQAEIVREAHRLYNETAKRAGLPIAKVMNDARRRALALRVKEAGGLDGFREAMANLEASPFLTGQNDRGWRADIKFVCQPSSFAKLFEGAYNNIPGKKQVQSSRDDPYYGVE